ncbi:Zn-ribbon domain-containing OB-fold protein [Thermodesulfobacteriota bacterium]
MNKKNDEMGEKSNKATPIEEGIFHQPSSPDEEPYLIGVKCNVCGLKAFPKTPVCPRCLEKDTMEEAHIMGKGKLDSFSIVRAALPGFKAPSIQAYINLEEGPRIWSLVTGCEPSEEALKPGMDMELVIARVREDARGNEIVSYQFKPVME